MTFWSRNYRDIVIIRSVPLRNTICFRLKIKSLVRSYEVDLKLYIYRTSDNFLSGGTHIFGEFCVSVVAEITKGRLIMSD